MSHKVVTLVCSRIVGSAAQKAVLVNMADKASDGGEGVFASKATIAAETEQGLSTVKRAINELLARDLIVEVGLKACTNGHTVVYDMNLPAIAALDEWKPSRSSSRTPSSVNPVQSGPGPERTVTRSRVDRDPVQSGPQTVLEPSLNQEKEEEGARAMPVDLSLVSKLTHALGFDHHGQIPRYWISPDAGLIVARWQTDLGLTPDEIVHVAIGNIRAHNSPANGPKTLTRHMQDFAAAKDAPRLEPTKGSPNVRPSTSPRNHQSGQGQQLSGLAGAAMRRRAAREQGHEG